MRRRRHLTSSSTLLFFFFRFPLRGGSNVRSRFRILILPSFFQLMYGECMIFVFLFFITTSVFSVVWCVIWWKTVIWWKRSSFRPLDFFFQGASAPCEKKIEKAEAVGRAAAAPSDNISCERPKRSPDGKIFFPHILYILLLCSRLLTNTRNPDAVFPRGDPS